VSWHWIDDAIFYHIYPLGMVSAPEINEGRASEGARILEVTEWIPHLQSMHVNALYFGPVFDSHSHGYDTSDYTRTDRRLGTESDFKTVFSALKSSGFRIVLDGVFNHVGREFWAFRDLLLNREQSKYREWFSNVCFGEPGPAGDGFSYDTWQGHAELVKLNLSNPDVVDHLLGAVGMWMDRFDIDGLRLDAADCVDLDFFKRLKAFCRLKKPDFWLMGEIIHGDYNRYANEEILDSTTNYECWKGIYSSHNDRNYFEIAHSLKRQFGPNGIYSQLRLYNFLDNHDVNRIAGLLRDRRHIFNAYTLLYTMPGIPSVYYGSEWGIEGLRTQGHDADRPVRPALKIADMLHGDTSLLSHIESLGAKRMRSEALRSGRYEEILVKNEQYCFARSTVHESAVVMLNLSDQTFSFNVSYRGKTYQSVVPPCDSVILISEESYHGEY